MLYGREHVKAYRKPGGETGTSGGQECPRSC